RAAGNAFDEGSWLSSPLVGVQSTRGIGKPLVVLHPCFVRAVSITRSGSRVDEAQVGILQESLRQPQRNGGFEIPRRGRRIVERIQMNAAQREGGERSSRIARVLGHDPSERRSEERRVGKECKARWPA